MRVRGSLMASAQEEILYGKSPRLWESVLSAEPQPGRALECPVVTFVRAEWWFLKVIFHWNGNCSGCEVSRDCSWESPSWLSRVMFSVPSVTITNISEFSVQPAKAASCSPGLCGLRLVRGRWAGCWPGCTSPRRLRSHLQNSCGTV